MMQINGLKKLTIERFEQMVEIYPPSLKSIVNSAASRILEYIQDGD
jgi:hypothetical protein